MTAQIYIFFALFIIARKGFILNKIKSEAATNSWLGRYIKDLNVFYNMTSR